MLEIIRTYRDAIWHGVMSLACLFIAAAIVIGLQPVAFTADTAFPVFIAFMFALLSVALAFMAWLLFEEVQFTRI